MSNSKPDLRHVQGTTQTCISVTLKITVPHVTLTITYKVSCFRFAFSLLKMFILFHLVCAREGYVLASSACLRTDHSLGTHMTTVDKVSKLV